MFRSLNLLLVSCLILLIGCGKQEEKSSASAQSPSGVTNVVLEYGKGAVLVTHPKPNNFERTQWMTQIQLEGKEPTDRLPIVPLADLQAGLVLNVPPGNYKVVSSAWIRRDPPASGGSQDHVMVNAGEVVVLQAGDISGDEYPYPNTLMTIQARHKWTLRSPSELQDFIAGMIN
ncbi:hypothetical protein KKC97_12540 [bacterium]|nr:hypothetical protein [bacterium]MBU1638484.1 hypothetical protein [bacterium]